MDRARGERGPEAAPRWTRKRYLWRLAGRELQLGDRTLVAGAIHLAPQPGEGESLMDPGLAADRALAMEAQGADLIIAGAVLYRPGTPAPDVEWRRLAPVLKRLRGKLAIPVVVETAFAEVAERGLDLEAAAVADPTGLTADPQLAKVVAQRNAGLILIHRRGTPDTWAKLPSFLDPMGTIVQELGAAVHRARRAGIDQQRMAVDPGLGFGKRKEENSRVIAEIGRLGALELPVVAAPARSGALPPTEAPGKLMATAAAAAALVLGGVHIIAAGEVAEVRVAVQVADTVARVSA